MRVLVWIVILFAMAVGIALLLENFHGSVHFIIEDTIYSLNIYTLVVFLLVFWFVCSLVLYILRHVIGIPYFLRKFNQKRHEHQAEYLLNEVGMAFFEGRYQKAQQLVEKLLSNKEASDKLPLGLLLAAYSADEAGNEEARDNFLTKIKKLPQYNPLPTYLLLAKRALIKKDLPSARTHIQAAMAINSNLTQVLKLDLSYALENNDAETVMKHCERLEKNGALTDKEAENYRLFVYQHRLATAHDAKSLKRCLKKIPESEKSGKLVVEIAQKYKELSLFVDAAKWIRKYYPKTKNIFLLNILNEIFPLLSNRLQNNILDELTNELQENSSDKDLLFTLGEMSIQKQLWGKAKGFLQTGLEYQQSVRAHLSLANVLTEMKEDVEAKEHRLIALDLIEQNERQAEENESTDDEDNDKATV